RVQRVLHAHSVASVELLSIDMVVPYPVLGSAGPAMCVSLGSMEMAVVASRWDHVKFVLHVLGAYIAVAALINLNFLVVDVLPARHVQLASIELVALR